MYLSGIISQIQYLAISDVFFFFAILHDLVPGKESATGSIVASENLAKIEFFLPKNLVIIRKLFLILHQFSTWDVKAEIHPEEFHSLVYLNLAFILCLNLPMHFNSLIKNYLKYNRKLWQVLISHMTHWACSEAKKSFTILK